MDLRQRVQRRNEKLNKLFLIVMAVIVIISVAGFAFQNGADEKTGTVSAAETVNELPAYTVDSDAEHICLTTDYLNVRVGPDIESDILGVLDEGTSITVLDSDDPDWGYAKEFKGYVYRGYLKDVPVSDVVGVACTKSDTHPIYFSNPEGTGDATVIDGYNSYVIRPIVYNGKYVQIGENAYIDKEHVVIDYYDRDYYEHVIEVRTSRGFMDRDARQTMRKGISMVISEPSGLSVKEISRMTDGTALHGIAPALKEIEEKNGVNAIFALSVAMLESGNGESYLARNQNNIFGLDPYNGGMSFEDKSECVQYFGKLIQKYYFGNGRDSLADINQIYEPYNSNWSVMVQDIMYENRSKVGR